MGANGTRGEPRKVKSLGELAPAIAPARDLWPQIEAQIAAERAAPAAPRGPRRWAPPPRWLAAAAMLACVAVGIWIGRAYLPGATPQVPASVNGTARPPQLSQGTVLDAAYVSDPRYQRARTALLKSAQAQIEALPPASRAKVVASLKALQSAKEDLEQALGKDPSNALLQELLVNTYQDEMRVLTDLHQAGDTGRGI
jgi:hypothetical protein